MVAFGHKQKGLVGGELSRWGMTKDRMGPLGQPLCLLSLGHSLGQEEPLPG